MIKIFVCSMASGIKFICPGYHNIRQKAKDEKVKTIYIFLSETAKIHYFNIYQKLPENWRFLWKRR